MPSIDSNVANLLVERLTDGVVGRQSVLDARFDGGGDLWVREELAVCLEHLRLLIADVQSTDD